MFNWFERARDYCASLSRPKFEALILGISLLIGLIVMPVLIYLAGHYTLNEYANGGLSALLADFYKGLIDLRPSCWIVVAGPMVFLTLLRIFRLVLRKV